MKVEPPSFSTKVDSGSSQATPGSATLVERLNTKALEYFSALTNFCLCQGCGSEFFGRLRIRFIRRAGYGVCLKTRISCNKVRSDLDPFFSRESDLGQGNPDPRPFTSNCLLSGETSSNEMEPCTNSLFICISCYTNII